MNNSQINNIEWKDGAVCFANGWQWFYDCAKIRLSNLHGCCLSYHNATLASDFQLNEPRQGDYIPKSELYTEQKYNDAVEVFGLFGFNFCGSATSEYNKLNKHDFITCCDDGLWQTSSDRWNKRPLAYNQLMAIGKLKRLINELNNTVLSLDEETELKSRSMASELNSQSNDDEWPKVGDDATHSVCGLCKVMSLADSNGVVAVLNESGFNVLVFNSDLSKPKTPEDILSEELAKKGVQDVYILACQIINGEFDSIKYVQKNSV